MITENLMMTKFKAPPIKPPEEKKATARLNHASSDLTGSSPTPRLDQTASN
jgi:hypothetical protein